MTERNQQPCGLGGGGFAYLVPGCRSVTPFDNILDAAESGNHDLPLVHGLARERAADKAKQRRRLACSEVMRRGSASGANSPTTWTRSAITLSASGVERGAWGSGWRISGLTEASAFSTLRDDLA